MYGNNLKTILTKSTQHASFLRTRAKSVNNWLLYRKRIPLFSTDYD